MSKIDFYFNFWNSKVSVALADFNSVTKAELPPFFLTEKGTSFLKDILLPSGLLPE